MAISRLERIVDRLDGRVAVSNLSDFDADRIDNDRAKAAAEGSAPKSSFPFEAMNLRVGDRLQIQPPAKISTERCNVRLIGYLTGASLLVTAPVSASGVRLQLLEREQVVIRVFSSLNAFGFACEIDRICKLPYHYLHLTFPLEVQGTVIRKAPRVKTKITSTVSGHRGGDNIPAIISNLSASGALLDARRGLLEKNDTLKLTFRVKLHNVDAHLSVSAVVRAVFSDDVLEESHSKLAHYGLEFMDLEPNDAMILQSLIYQQMIKHPESMV